MGALISAPIAELLTCLGGCCGTFLAAGCCKLAAAGNVSSEQAAAFALAWLQVFVTALALLLQGTAGQWTPQTCEKLDQFGLGGIGICQCLGVSSSCWPQQLVYRVEFAAFVVFLVLLILTISGCAAGASRLHTVGKFMAVPLLCFVLLFVPNGFLTAFGATAGFTSAAFLVVQAVLLIDFGYSWAQTWYGNALEARQREMGIRGYRIWQGSILAASAVLFIASIVCSVCLFIAFTESAPRVMNICAVVIALLLLCISISSWCQHGALLTSTVVMLYTTWLLWEAFAVNPEHPGDQPPVWLCLLVNGISLMSFAAGAKVRKEQGPEGLMAVEIGQAAQPATDGTTAAAPTEATESEPDVMNFSVQCLVHLAAVLYITSSLAPGQNMAIYILRSVAVFASLALYGWSLVAPKILTNRTFG